MLPLGDVLPRGWVEFDIPSNSSLLLLDLRESGCVKLGIPTDAVHARNQAAGRALGRLRLRGSGELAQHPKLSLAMRAHDEIPPSYGGISCIG